MEPPQRSEFNIRKLWEIYTRLQAQDMELLSLEIDNLEHAERASAIIALRDSLWKEKCMITDHLAGIPRSRKRKCGTEQNSDISNIDCEPRAQPFKRNKLPSRGRLAFHLSESDDETGDGTDGEYDSKPESHLRTQLNFGFERNPAIIADTGPPVENENSCQSVAEKGNIEEPDVSIVAEDFAFVEIDATNFNAASQQNNLRRENRLLRRDIKLLEKNSKIMHPLFMVGVAIRKRWLNDIRGKHYMTKDPEVNHDGNRAAHQGNILADMALLDYLGDEAEHYRSIIKIIYKSVWSPRDIAGWEDIAWDDKNCELIDFQATCRANRDPDSVLQPELATLAARVANIASTVNGDGHLFYSLAKRTKVNSDTEVQRLVHEIRELLKKEKKSLRRAKENLYKGIGF